MLPAATAKTNRFIAQWVKYTYDCCDALDLIDKTHIEWNNRMTTTFADALYFCGVARLRFSTKIWGLALEQKGEQEAIDTVIHEACHIVDKFQGNPYHKATKGHGPTWKALMSKCGIPAERFHYIDCGEIRRKRGRVEVKCINCGTTGPVTKHRYTRYMNNGGMIHKGCGGKFIKLREYQI